MSRSISTKIDAVIFVSSLLIGGLTIALLVAESILALAPLTVAILGIAYVTLDVDQLDRWIASPATTSLDPDREAVALLRQRYARGEIDDTEFERRLNALVDTQTIEQAQQYEQSESPNGHGS